MSTQQAENIINSVSDSRTLVLQEKILTNIILRRFRKKTPILLNRMSKNGLGRFLGEPTLKT